MKNAQTHVAAVLVVIEGILSLPVFLLSWWVSSIYRSVIAGWKVSGLKSNEKRAAIAALMGDDDHTS